MLIEMRAALVKAAIHFDDEPRGGSAEVRDVATDDDLTTEGDAETAAAQLGPEQLLGERWVAPQMVRLRGELVLALGGLATLIG